MRFLLKALIVAALCWSAVALAQQQQDLIGLTDFPVPAWPDNGVIPEAMKENYVFVDLAKNEYVVVYPENLGTDAFKDGPGKLKMNRYPLLRNVAPAINVAITAVAAGRLKYAYTVANGANAKQSIDAWVLALSDGSAKDVVKALDGWFALTQTARKFKLRNPEWIRTGGAAIWSFQKPEVVIAPGESKGGFELESELRPGFTVAFARKSEAVDVKTATQGNVPKDVKEQMDQILQLEYNSQTVLTLGPKFDKAADDHTIAEDFIQGIFLLSRAGKLELSSDFVRNTLNDLTAVKAGTSASGVVKLATAPRGAVETELASALKISLKL